MNSIRAKFAAAPILVRVVPFVAFILLTGLQGKLGVASHFWIYLVKTLAGAALLWIVWPLIEEMRWKLSWEGVAVGVGVFVMWVALDPFYPKLDQFLSSDSKPAFVWNPHEFFGAGTGLAWFFIAVRTLGSSLVVPPLEEVFFRSFLYRYIAKQDFLSVPLGWFSKMPFLVTSLIFAFEHSQWLAGLLCGFAYQGLVCWKKRLGDAMTAHAITNFLLALWVAGRGAWQFW